jgi:hypothetical protein
MIFEFAIDNTIDIITNSSSELFVLNGRTKEIVHEMISEIYPGYEREYRLTSTQDCDKDDIDTYISQIYDTYNDDFVVCKQIGMRPNELYKNFGEYGVMPYWRGEYTEDGYKLLLSKLPKNTFLLFSLDENPNWDYQERLMAIATRYHLG